MHELLVEGLFFSSEGAQKTLKHYSRFQRFLSLGILSVAWYSGSVLKQEHVINAFIMDALLYQMFYRSNVLLGGFKFPVQLLHFGEGS